ncbi:nucleoredoxin-like protein 1 isoform X1 [Nothobranchius furzeri]|uniref:Nucleoredoxin like 1 n=2 Tax=Nothobranchius TaxID=28779 RepID=A0A8C6LZZ6_NOTFU|nr:nucleoredoxin-like protein 1 isoform X1 [Nothobranchius furzeri]KAF7223752.1 transcript variant X1 [Nothobranchius furzeri]
MVDLFLNQVLVENNSDQDKLNTEREIIGILENRILLLFFAAAECEKCQKFLPTLNDFFKKLKDPAYIEYPKLLALVYIRSIIFISELYWLMTAGELLMRYPFPLSSLDQSEEQQERVLKELNKRILFLAFEDPYRKELQSIFQVKDIPAVVALRPDGSVLSPNAVQDISRLGTTCFRNWQESAELVERTFMLNEEFDDPNLRSATDPVRRLKYKTVDDKRKKSWWKLWEGGKDTHDEEEKDETWNVTTNENKGLQRRRAAF